MCDAGAQTRMCYPLSSSSSSGILSGFLFCSKGLVAYGGGGGVPAKNGGGGGCSVGRNGIGSRD